MRFASFVHQDGAGFGAVLEDRVVDLSGQAPTLRAAFAQWGLDGLCERASRGTPRPLAGLRWLPPITDPDKTLCVGLNYFLHAQEAKMAVPEHPSLFARFPAAQVGHGEPVVRPRASHRFDYEAELAVVIGRAGRHIAGRGRRGVRRGLQLLRGELGARLADAFAAGDARQELRAQRRVRAVARHAGRGGPGRVDGRVRAPQRPRDAARLGREHDLHGPAGIAYVSTFITLLPGDVLVTGTPAGVGFTRDPPVWLQPGDRFEVEITNVGVLSNEVVDEPPQEGR